MLLTTAVRVMPHTRTPSFGDVLGRCLLDQSVVLAEAGLDICVEENVPVDNLLSGGC
jgi:hypothetical protein